MALMHRADVRPSKLEIISAWLPGRPWLPEPLAGPVMRVGSCRFDDPAGEVGLEMILVRAGAGPLLHVPLTYRGAPLDDGERFLVGTVEHSVLGRRWVYDACGDPVYAAALADAILTGGTEATEYFEVDGRREYRESDLTVRGDGTGTQVRGVTTIHRVDDGDPTVIRTEAGELVVVRTPGELAPVAGARSLTGAWQGGDGVLAYARGF